MLPVQTGVRHAVQTVVEVYPVAAALVQLTTDLLCLETAMEAADLLCVVLVAVLVAGCLTSGPDTLLTVELLVEAEAVLLSVTTAALICGFTDVALTVVTVAATPLVLV